MKLVALTNLPNQRKAGDVFEVPDKLGRILILTKKAKAADAEPPPPASPAPATTTTPAAATVQDVGDVPSDQVTPDPAAPRRSYRRRDLRAEE